MKKYIFCVGLHKEGGLNILNNFLKLDNDKYIYFLDERVDQKITKKNTIIIKKDILSRIINLIFLSFKLEKNDHIVFLNGLPPIFKFKCEVSVIFQNANLFRKFYKISFFQWLFSRDFLRFLIFFFGKENVNNWYVFSPISKKILNHNLKKYVSIKYLNIYDEYNELDISNVSQIEYDFIYPASFMRHKNHQMIFNILIKLSKKKIFPRVVFTLDTTSKKKVNFDILKEKYQLKIFNYFEKDRDSFLKIYKKCNSLLYMSSNETIGLPIIEANKYNLFIIAPKLEYSDQFIQPDAQFDINSESELTSIIEECLKTNFKNKKKKILKIPSSSISFDDFVNKII